VGRLTFRIQLARHRNFRRVVVVTGAATAYYLSQHKKLSIALIDMMRGDGGID
jgi:hypothetical protein